MAKLVCSYKYTDSGGNLLFTKHRYDPKSFSIEGLDNSKERVLYNLYEVVASDIVLFVEGERDVETLRNLGYVATSAFSGSNSPWLPSYSGILKDKTVYVFPDQDEAGKKYCNTIKEGLAGYSKVLKVINVPEGKDITEYIELGHTREDIESLISFAVEEKPIKKARVENKKLREPAATQSEKLVLGAILNGTS